jgi:hypothetical protein
VDAVIDNEPPPSTIPTVIAALDSVMDELRALRRQVQELQSQRDYWRARSQWKG